MACFVADSLLSKVALRLGGPPGGGGGGGLDCVGDGTTGLARGIGGALLVRLVFSAGEVGVVGETIVFDRPLGERGSSGLLGKCRGSPGTEEAGSACKSSSSSGTFKDNLLALSDISSSDSSPGLGDLIPLGGGGGTGRASTP